MQVRHIFLPDYYLVLSLLKPRGVSILEQKKSYQNRISFLNSSIDKKYKNKIKKKK